MIATCPHCLHDQAKVTHSRSARRRLLCCGCGKRYTLLASGETVTDMRVTGHSAHIRRLKASKLLRRLAVIDTQADVLRKKRTDLLTQLATLA